MSICIKDQIQNMNLVIGCTVGCAYCYARNNVKRWHMIDDFADPEFFPGKLKMMEKKRPQNFLLTGMSDLSGWKPEWRDEVFAKIHENPQHQFLFLTKRPDLLDFDTDLENAWFGVTVTRKAELWRIDALRKNVRAKHYHVTFEPLFDDPGTVDLSGINWIVAGIAICTPHCAANDDIHVLNLIFDTNTHDFCHSSRFFLMRSRHSSNWVISSSEKPL